MKRLQVFLCDLTHTGNKIGTSNMPLSIGFLAAFAKKHLGDAVEFRLFKYPERLLGALAETIPDVIGFSTYVWNDALNASFCDFVKERSPQTITVLGGPNLPLANEGRAEYMQEHANADYFFIHEGERSFTKFLEKIVGGKLIRGAPVEGAVYMAAGQLIVGDLLPRIMELDDIPSPYLEGLMDEFFDGRLVPMLETTRGCPFTCTYCNAGSDYYTKTKLFSMERVVAELRHIGERAEKVGITHLLLTDMNFGMFPRDLAIAKEMMECRRRFCWPHSIYIETGKNRIDNVSNVIETLKDCISIKLSLQSHTPAVLNEIERQNIDPQAYWRLCNQLKERGQSVVAELILCLPLESLETYRDGIRFLMESKVDRIINYSLQLNNGTKFTDHGYLSRFGYDSRWRPYANCFGRYLGKTVIETERVGVATKDMSFEDYIELRGFAFAIELIYNTSIFNQVLHLIRKSQKSPFDFVTFCYANRHQSPLIARAFDDFLVETRNELFLNRSDLVEHFSQEDNYDSLKNGDVGRNVIFSNLSIVFTQHLDEFTNFVMDMAALFLGEQQSHGVLPALAELRIFMILKSHGIFDPVANPVEQACFTHDWLALMGNENLRLSDVRTPVRFKFIFTENQTQRRQDNFQRYGVSPAGLAKILASSDYNSLFRNVVRAE